MKLISPVEEYRIVHIGIVLHGLPYLLFIGEYAAGDIDMLKLEGAEIY